MELEKIAKNEYHFIKTVFSKLGAGILILDLITLDYQWINHQYKDMLGYDTEEMYSNSKQFDNEIWRYIL